MEQQERSSEESGSGRAASEVPAASEAGLGQAWDPHKKPRAGGRGALQGKEEKKGMEGRNGKEGREGDPDREEGEKSEKKESLQP